MHNYALICKICTFLKTAKNLEILAFQIILNIFTFFTYAFVGTLRGRKFKIVHPTVLAFYMIWCMF